MNAQLSQEIDQALAQLEEVQSSLEQLEPINTPPAQSRTNLWPIALAFGLGMATGAAVVAIAWGGS